MTTVQTLRTGRQAAPGFARGAYCYDFTSGSLQFDWRGVAASAVGAGVGQAVGGQLGNSFGGRLATGLIAGTAAAVMRGGKIAIQQVAVDAFGNAVGASLAGASISDGTRDPSSADYQNEMDRASDRYNPATEYAYRNGSDIASDNYNPGAAWAADVAARRHAINPLGLPTNRASIGMGADAGNTNGLDLPPDYQGQPTSGNDALGDRLLRRMRDADIDAAVARDARARAEAFRRANEASVAGLADRNNPATYRSAGAYYSATQATGLSYGGAAATAPGVGMRAGSIEDHSLYVAPGVITSSYQQGVAMMANGNLPWTERIVGGAAATLMAPMMLLEETGRALMNVPYHGSQMGQNAAQFNLATSNDERVVAGLKFINNASSGFVGATAFLPASVSIRPVMTAEQMAVAQFPGTAAINEARATYLGDVYSPHFVGPVQWEYFYRGDAVQRSTFLSPMAENRGVGAANSYLATLDDAAYQQMAARHSIYSDGSPAISITPNEQVARYFARGLAQDQNGWVSVFRVRPSEASSFAQYNWRSDFNTRINPSIGLKEQEFLVPGRIDPKHLLEQYQVGPR